MKLIKMTGGLGNQMFIYAFYLRMRKHFPHIRIDLSDMMHYHVHHGYELPRLFRATDKPFCLPQKLKKVMEFLFFTKIYERKQRPTADIRPFLRRRWWPLLYFKGFYQSECYFADMADEIREAFRFDLSQINEQTAALMKCLDTDDRAVSLHVRRGDYLQPQHWNNTGSVCGLPYFINAIAALCERVKDPHFYVFSDDLAWVKAHLPLERATFIDWNRGTDSWQDMLLMSHCRHHIISNSTFSWWGAWLNAHKDKIVIVPERWFRHQDTPYIYPKDWIKVSIN